jgi:hypothetical protein
LRQNDLNGASRLSVKWHLNSHWIASAASPQHYIQSRFESRRDEIEINADVSGSLLGQSSIAAMSLPPQAEFL